MMIYIKKSGSEELVALRAHKTKKKQLYIIYVTSLYIPLKTLTENILFELPYYWVYMAYKTVTTNIQSVALHETNME